MAHLGNTRSRYLLAMASVAASLLAVACTGSPQSQPRQQSGAQSRAAHIAPASADACAGQPPVTSLPAWARSGFTPADAPMPHVLGAAGNIVAILWAPADALHAPPLAGRANKILWVSRLSSGPMTIRATLAGSARTATVDLPDGPGPSYVDMPVPGCWTMHLSWGGHSDQLSLRYTA
ncbi:MAG TPA: hypothetical protein VHZ33_02795 [Trebonia sp.]|nr:hypothetical protein [Trebonia sp.]